MDDVLREKADLLRKAIQTSRNVHKTATAALDSIAGRIATIDDTILPIQARVSEATNIHDNVRKSLRSLDSMTSQLHLLEQAERVILNKPRKGLSAYLDAIDKLRNVEYFFHSKRNLTNREDVLKRVDELLSKAAAELENDFRKLLSKCSKLVELGCLFNSLPSLEHRLPHGNISADTINASPKDACDIPVNENAAYTLPTLIDPRYIPLLEKLVQKSVQLGCPQQFLKIYREIRGSTLQLNLKHLGVEYVTTEEMRNTQAESMGAKIAQWTQFYQIGVKLLLAAERKLCDQIFQGKHTLKDICFAEVAAKSLSTLLSFGQAVAKSQASPEMLFMLIDMYEATLELQSEVEVVFQGYACSEHRRSALNLTKCLALTIQRSFNEFKENILKDSPNSTTTDGDVHPLTHYVVNYTKFLFDYQESLKEIFEESDANETNSGLASQITDVLHALETNLQAKSKQYKNHCLQHLFMMNNIHYIISSVCGSEVTDLFGDDWVQTRRRIVQHHAIQYIRVSWGKALEFLSSRGLISTLDSAGESNRRSCQIIGFNSSIASKSVIKERFGSFNIQFEEVCQSQMNWVIADEDLRENLILVIAEILLPAYSNFLKRFGPFVGNNHSSSKYIKYSPEELEGALGNLFAKKLVTEPGCLLHQEPEQL